MASGEQPGNPYENASRVASPTCIGVNAANEDQGRETELEWTSRPTPDSRTVRESLGGGGKRTGESRPKRGGSDNVPLSQEQAAPNKKR
jgi:hypothetical protein